MSNADFPFGTPVLFRSGITAWQRGIVVPDPISSRGALWVVDVTGKRHFISAIRNVKRA